MRWRCALYEDLSFVASFFKWHLPNQVLILMMFGDLFIELALVSIIHCGDKSLVLVFVWFFFYDSEYNYLEKNKSKIKYYL